jgi:hypothetical protein
MRAMADSKDQRAENNIVDCFHSMLYKDTFDFVLR